MLAKTKLSCSAFLLLLLVFGWLRWHQSAGLVSENFPDTVSYLRVSELPLDSLAFWQGKRAALYPLMMRLTGGEGGDGGTIRDIQMCFGILAFAVLALCAGSLFTRVAPKVLAYVFIFQVGLMPEVTRWDATTLSESVSISLSCLLISAWIAWTRKPSIVTDVALVAAGGAFCMVRDVNTYYFVAAIALSLLLFLRDRPLMRHWGAVMALAASAFVLIDWSAENRWQTPFMHLLESRLLTDKSTITWFEENGMPQADALGDMLDKGVLAPGKIRTDVSRDEEKFAEFHAWATSPAGKRVYMKYLLTHPQDSLVGPFMNQERYGAFATWSQDEYLNRYNPRAFELPSFAGLYDRCIRYNGLRDLILLVAFLAICVALVLARVPLLTRENPMFPLALAALAAVPFFYVSWHGDFIEVPRHTYGAFFLWRLTLGLATFCGVDLLLRAVPWARFRTKPV